MILNFVLISAALQTDNGCLDRHCGRFRLHGDFAQGGFAGEKLSRFVGQNSGVVLQPDLLKV